jgi:hypothetical protein
LARLYPRKNQGTLQRRTEVYPAPLGIKGSYKIQY